MSKNYNNEILNDCAWFADKHRGNHAQSGPYWSTIIRFPKLYDEAVRLQKRVDTLEAYIDEFTPDSMRIAQLKAENERLAKENELMVETIKSLIASKNKLEDAYEYAKNNILLIYETATRLKGAQQALNEEKE